MKPEEIAEIKKRCEAATAEPWESDALPLTEAARNLIGYPIHGAWTQGRLVFSNANEIDADFIAHARSDIPSLLDYVATLEDENERLRKELEVVDDALEDVDDDHETWLR